MNFHMAQFLDAKSKAWVEKEKNLNLTLSKLTFCFWKILLREWKDKQHWKRKLTNYRIDKRLISNVYTAFYTLQSFNPQEAYNSKTDSAKCWRSCRMTGDFIYCHWNCKMIKSLWFKKKKKKGSFSFSYIWTKLKSLTFTMRCMERYF